MIITDPAIELVTMKAISKSRRLLSPTGLLPGMRAFDSGNNYGSV
jgi:hypothetical protein